MSQWREEHAVAIAAARQAGEILQARQGKFTVRQKAINDLVTEVDQEAQQAIADTIAATFPQDEFLGEENITPLPTIAARLPGIPSGKNWQEKPRHATTGRRWIVDPIDGTLNYVHGFPFYCVSIAFEAAGAIRVGVLYDPVRAECFHAIAGAGALCNQTELAVSRWPSLAEALLTVGLAAQVSGAAAEYRLMAGLGRQVQSLRRLGSSALALGYVAAGRCDGFYSQIVQPWDVAAGLLLIQEAGGRVTNLDLSPYDLYTPDILASNGFIHEPLGRAIQSLLPTAAVI